MPCGNVSESRVTGRGGDSERMAPDTTMPVSMPKAKAPTTAVPMSPARLLWHRLDTHEHAFHRETYIANVAQSALHVFLETELQSEAECRWCTRWQRAEIRLRAEHRGERVRKIFAFEGTPADEHLVEHGAEGPNIRALVDVLSFCLLRAHIRGRSQDHTDPSSIPRDGGGRRAAGIGRVLHEGLGQAEVQDFDLAVRRQLDVGRLQVTMNDPALVRFLQGVRNLVGDVARLFDGNGSKCDPLSERLSLDELENEVVRALRLLQPVDRGNVRMVQRGQYLGFSLETRESLRILGEGIG